jgi:hypothetical protein
VTLDGNITSLNGISTDPIGLFNLSIFHQSGLDPSKPHSITLTNGPNGAGDVDIDWIDIEVGDGNIAYGHHIQAPMLAHWLHVETLHTTYGWTTHQPTSHSIRTGR